MSERKFYKVNERVWHLKRGIPAIVKEIIPSELSAVVKYFDDDKNQQEEKVNFWDIDKYKRGLSIKIKYFDDEIKRLEKIAVGDWIDLRSAEDVEMKQFEFKLIPLGVAMELPKGFEAMIVPRSSTFNKFGIIQTNSPGIIDNTYKGDNDQWFFPALAMIDTKISKGDRICQFRIERVMPKVKFFEVDSLENDDRGGHGSTGKQ